MDTNFINSKNSKTFDPDRLLLNLLDKIHDSRVLYTFVPNKSFG